MTQLWTEAPAGVGGDVAQIVESAVQQVRHLATLPATALELIRLAEDPDSSPHETNRVIANDPALSARILKVVNSTFYGLPRKIASIDHAILLLGVNALKNIAIAASLDKVFRGGQICPVFNARGLWTHSIAAAAGARLLAERTALYASDEAFLAGLIHDVGIMAEIQTLRPMFVQVVEKLAADQSLTFRQAEQQVLGATHEAFGAGLCRKWKFPISLEYVAGYHHRPTELTKADNTLTAIVHVADILAARAGVGYTRTVETDVVDPRLLDLMNLTPADLNDVADALLPAVDEAQSLLS